MKWALTGTIAWRKQWILGLTLAVANTTDIAARVAARGAAAARPRADHFSATSSTPFPCFDVRRVLYIYLLDRHSGLYTQPNFQLILRDIPLFHNFLTASDTEDASQQYDNMLQKT